LLLHIFQEKIAWELDTEPYKCDNSKLLSENNQLHLELLKLREKYDLELADLRNKLRNSKTDNKILKGKYSDLLSRASELAHKKDVPAMGNLQKQ
jgi:regulator of replication initiation timing